MLETPPSLWPPERNERSKMVNPTLPRADFYVYVFFRPNGIPCYVGKGHGRRWERHEKVGKPERGYNTRLNRIIALAGGSLPKIKVRENLTEKDAFETERSLIAAIGRADRKLGPLVNLTDGGEGSTGTVVSEATRAKFRARKFSAATRAQMSASGSGRPHAPEHVEKVAAAQRGKPKASGHTSLMAYHANMTPEQRAARSAKIRIAMQRWRDKGGHNERDGSREEDSGRQLTLPL